MSRLLARALAAAALLSAPAAFAAGFQAEVGFGSANTSASGVHGQSALIVDAAFGYRFTPAVGVRAMAFSEFDGNRTGGSAEPAFANFVGLEATGHAELSPTVNLMGGLGLGQAAYFDAEDGRAKAAQTTPVLSGGLQWKLGHRFAMELHADYLTTAKVTNLALLFQIPF
jgi:hypothetical protein